MPFSKYTEFAVGQPFPGVFHVEFNREKAHYSTDRKTYLQYNQLLKEIDSLPEAKVIVLSGKGKHFLGGLDVKSVGGLLVSIQNKTNGSYVRKEGTLKPFIKEFQESIEAPAKIGIPVISAIHGACIGLGLDYIAATSIRYATKDSFYQIPEIHMGFAADIGALQRLHVMVNNKSKFNDLVLTGRKFNSKLALELGIVSELFDSKEELVKEAFKTAKIIAQNTREAIVGTKLSCSVMFEGATVQEGLEWIRDYNARFMPQKFGRPKL